MGEVKPDIAVVDLNLRDGFTGPTVARELANRYGTKVLFLTGNPREVGETFDGVLGVVNKPWQEEDLREVVAKVRTLE